MAIRQPSPPRTKPPTRPKWQSKYHGVRMTPEEYLALPEEKPYLEYVDGVVLQKPMPNRDHIELAAEIIFRIKLWIVTHGGRTGPEARTKLGDLPNYRLPDVSFWRAGMSRDDDTLPSVAVEVRSPGQTLAELRRKCELFRDAGVETCWLIDPVSRTAEVYEGRGKKGKPVDILTAECMPGFALALTELFAVLDENTRT